MLSLERTKELLNDPSLSDKEIEEIRDGFYQLAQIIFEKWKEDKKTGKLNRFQRPCSNKTKSMKTPPESPKNDQNQPLYFKKEER